ncbi:MAG TPA: filamentous hemagglutinin N-terminal domain-containing protein, partial [Propionibacteriaceae bacterium]
MSVPGYAAGPPITPSGLNTNVAGPISVNGKTQYDITGGTRPGGGTNLFHSFGDFNVPNNNVANFLNAGSADLAGNPLAAGLPTSNILGRVTGGNISNIFGAIHTTNFGAANLFLMNPAGFLFGPNATVNVGGMVAFTSADYLRLADGVRFNAIPNAVADALLNVAPVAAFGFLGSNPGAITIQGSQFTVTEGTGISLLGGNITIQSGSLDNETVQPARLTAPGGQINLASVSTPGEVLHATLQPASNLNGQSFTTMGNMTLSGGSTLDISANAAGTVRILGGQFVMDSASITATSVNGPGGGIDLHNTPSTIAITADTVALGNGTQITAHTQGTAPAGDITFNVDNLTTAGGLNRINAHPEDTFNAPVAHEVGVLIASNSTGSNAEAGPAGMITIQGVNGPGSAAKSISLNDTTLSTKVFGGTADTTRASIIITADSLALGTATDPVNVGQKVIIEAVSAGAAPAGNIALNVNTLQADVKPDGTPIKGAGGVFLNTVSQSRDNTGGPAGTVTISGPAPEPTDAATLVALDKTFITTTVLGGTAATTPAATTITAKTLVLTAETGTPGFDASLGETGILAASAGAAPAGNVAFNVGTLQTNVKPDGTPMEVGHVFFASASDNPGPTAGRAGTVTISGTGPESTDAASQVTLRNTAITTSVAGGTAVTLPSAITLTADSVVLTVQTSRLWPTFGVISASSSGAAPAGNIAFNVGTFSADNAIMTSNSTGSAVTTGNAGSVSIQGVGGAGSLATAITLNRTTITTESNAGAGGPIALSATDITLVGSTISAAVTAGSQPGGHITMSADHHIMLSGGSVISAKSTGQGDAGNIQINANNLFAMSDSSVTTEATKASGGAIKIMTTPSGSVELADSMISASVLDGTGGGGSVNIDPELVILQNSQILANSVFGPGGNILITTNLLLPDSASAISASSQFGQQGTISIQSPISPASGKIVPLAQNPLLVTTLSNQRCAALAGGNASSFTVAGRDSLPAEPGGWVSSPLALSMAESNEGTATETTLSSF